MKKLVLASLIALAASQAAGCIITSGDDTGSDAFISATWQLRSEATNTQATCPPGFDTAALYNQPVDANGNNAGPVIVDLFNCADGAGTSAPLAPTTYLTWVEIAEVFRAISRASSRATGRSCSGGTTRLTRRPASASSAGNTRPV